MDDRLASRRYRLGLSLFRGSVLWLRWSLLLWVVATPILSVALSNVFEVGLWTITASIFQWFVAVTAGFWIYQNLPASIARGITRRELTVAYLVFGALTTVGTAALVTAGFAAEHALLAWFAEPFGTWGESLGQGARYLLITPIYFFTGTFIGAAAARFAGRAWFTIAVLLGTGLHYTGLLALEFRDLGSGGVAAWIAIALAVAAVLVTASVLTLRSAPVAAK